MPMSVILAVYILVFHVACNEIW